ncbi:AEC family transporter [Billgrantia tianxiuensis]|uniref:AEC family transporter n=1 Tax=Billgrantia tianxiuensis TaxID=2497861 RepID=UPI0030EDB50E
MLEILATTTPIFLLIGAGYLAMGTRLVNREQLQGVATFVLYFALPALVIRALTQNSLDQVLHTHYLLAYGLGSATIFGLALLLTLKRQRRPSARPPCTPWACPPPTAASSAIRWPPWFSALRRPPSSWP